LDNKTLEHYRSALNDPNYITHAVESVADSLIGGSIKLSFLGGEKYCPSCKKVKPLDDFYLFCKGRSPYCKKCYRALNNKSKKK
jgi:hypothetical protein